MPPEQAIGVITCARNREAGAAVILALLTLLVMTGLGVSLTLITMTETRIAASLRDAAEARYLAESVVERVLPDLVAAPDWNAVLTGAVTTTFVDGAPGARVTPDGTALDVLAETNLLNCASRAPCRDDQITESSEERPWGANNPRWQPVAHGPAASLGAGVPVDTRSYVMVWAADDPSDNDGDPSQDGGAPTAGPLNPGTGVILIRAHAYGPASARRAVQLLISREGGDEEGLGYGGQGLHGEQNRSARRAPVQVPGKGLVRTEMDTQTGSFNRR